MLEVLEAVTSITDDSIKVLVVGQPDRTFEKVLREQGGDHLILLGTRPFSELPRYLACADTVCLLQDPSNLITSYQLPAKVADALAFGLPVLATLTPPLKPLIDAGIVLQTSPETLAADLERTLSSEAVDAGLTQKRIDYFNRHFSYAKIGQRMAAAIVDAMKSEKTSMPNSHTSKVVDLVTGVYTSGDQLRRQSRESTQGQDIVLVWKQHDMFVYGRRPEMLARYLADCPDIRRILVLEPPLSHEFHCKWAHADVTHQHRALYVAWLLKSWGIYDTEKIRVHSFTYSKNRKPDTLVHWQWPEKSEYLNSIANFFEDNAVDPRRSVFLVYPKNELIPEIIQRFQPSRVISDVVDDHRTWPDVDRDKYHQLTRHYAEVLGLSEFAITNCEPVRHAMGEFHEDIRLLPNGVDRRIDRGHPLSVRYQRFSDLPHPRIGFAGNLEAKIDIDLLQTVAVARPNWQIILIGSTHANPGIMELDVLPNVHLPGVVPYEEVKHWIRDFDVAIIPHRYTEQTRHMNPLKVYVYASLGVPMVSTKVENLGGLAEYVSIAENHEQFIEAVEHELERRDNSLAREHLRREVENNSWACRVDCLRGWLMEDSRKRSDIHLFGKA